MKCVADHSELQEMKFWEIFTIRGGAAWPNGEDVGCGEGGIRLDMSKLFE